MKNNDNDLNDLLGKSTLEKICKKPRRPAPPSQSAPKRPESPSGALGKIEVRVGGSYFGSGGHSSGYKVISGEVVATETGKWDDGFTRGTIYNLVPKTKTATVWLFDSDGINGGRKTGKNGTFELVK